MREGTSWVTWQIRSQPPPPNWELAPPRCAAWWRAVTSSSSGSVGCRRIPDAEIERLRGLLGGDELKTWQQLEERAQQIEERRVAAEERLQARRKQLRKELNDLEAP